ncbi:M61 family metallopeptidase [Piscinibacter defluvii]|uniref:M61 family metallopeptidase n=1 Tax=Piscinibacter defluvii TaxID=1796922 RepID=UPI000FDE0333|nr:PDZ domain-containing protein [Piscinibacter defluvii]
MVTYRLDVADPNAHLFELTLTLPRPEARQQVSLPVWIPGSYLVREFARHLSGLRATQGGHERAVNQLDKATWEVACEGGTTLTLRWRVYAFDTSVRAAYLDATRGFFNGTGVFLRVHGRESEPHRLQIGRLPRGWEIATALSAAPGGGFVASDYDELVDHPVELGRFWRGEFLAHDVPHEFVVAGALPDFDGERLLADTQRLCEAQIAFWHGGRSRGKSPRAPFERYVFLLNTAEDGHGGLEHRASTALLSARRNLPARGSTEVSDNYVELLGLISHEYFHTWNVKRLRPAEFVRYDYTRENYTELLWFFEGFTSYYDDLFLRRCGLIDPARYLRLLGRTVTAVQASPGRQVQSVAQASFDAWVKYYRSDENTPNATISYYAKGALVALALDLSLRRDGGSLDAVLRRLWDGSAGGPIGEADVAAALEAVGGRSYARELADWVHGTGELPLQELLAAAGVAWQSQAPSMAQRLGLRVSESALGGIKATHVLRGGAAEAAGIAAGDELLALGGWRLRRLDDAQRVLRPGDTAELLAVRDQRVLSLSLRLPADASLGAPVQLAPAPKPNAAALALREAWLGR